MKKFNLVIILSLFFVTILNAQSDCTTATTATEGVNSFEAVSGQSYWFTYELAAGKKIVLSTARDGDVDFSSGSCDFPQFFESYTSGVNNTQYAKLNSGGTVFIEIQPSNTEAFNFELLEEDLEVGDNCLVAETAVEGANSFNKRLIRTENSIYEGEYWYKFDLPANKKLVVSNGGYKVILAGDDCNNPTYRAPDYNTGEAIFSQFVDGGEVFIRFFYGGTDYDGTAEFTLTVEDLEPGDNCVFAANAQMGTNIFQASRRKRQWYTYDLPAGKKITINSTNTGSVSFGKERSTDPTITDCVEYGLVGNSIDLPSAYYTGIENGGIVYFAINPAETEAFEFEVVISDFEAGDVCSLAAPVVVGTNTISVQEEMPYYVTYDLPAGKKFTVSSNSEEFEFINIEIYSGTECFANNNFTNGQGSLTYTELKDGGTVYITFNPYRTGTFEFDFIVSDFVPGDFCAVADVATAGTNSFEGTENTTYWYTYELSAGKKLTINSSNTGYVTMSIGSDCERRYGYEYFSPNGSYKELQDGGTVYIEVRPDQTGTFTFDLVEEDFVEGDLCRNAIIATDGVNSFTAQQESKTWFKYELTAGKKAVFSSDDQISFEVYDGSDCDNLNNQEYGYQQLEYVAVTEGGTLFIEVNNSIGGTSNFNITTEDFEPGDNCANPLTVVEGINTYGDGSGYEEVWYTYQLPAGKKAIFTTSYFMEFEAFSGADCNNLSSDANGYDQLTYTGLTEGGTLIVKVRNYSNELFEFNFATEDFAAGDNCTFAATAEEGTNTFSANYDVPYWYTFDLPAGKKINLTTEQEGEINIYTGSNCSNIDYQFEGEGNITYSELNEGGKLFFQVYPYQEGSFEIDITTSDLEAGDNCNIAAQAVEGVNSFEATNNAVKWFTFELPADKKAQITTSNNGYIYVRNGSNCDDLESGQGAYQNITYTALQNGGTLYIQFETYSAETFEFEIILQDFEPGDNCFNAVTASEGANSFTATDDYSYWFTYQVPASKKVSLSSTDELYYYIKSGAGCNSLSDRTIYGYQEVTFSEYENGGTIYIRIEPYQSGTVQFDLTLADTEQGDNCALAYTAVEGVNSFVAVPDKPQWFTFDLPAGKKAVFTSSDEIALGVSSGADCSNQSNYTGDRFQNVTFTALSDGGAINIMVESYESGTLEFNLALQDLVQGDNCTNPLTAQLNNNTTQSAPSWYRFEAQSTGNHRISSVGLTNTDTYLKVYSDCSGTLLAENDDIGNDLQSEVSLDLNTGEIIYILWDDIYDVEAFEWTILARENQTITVTDIEDKVTTAQPFEVEASTTSGLELSYDITGPANINGTTITLDGTVGAVRVTVSQAGNDNYNPASTSISFNVEKINQTITITEIENKIATSEPFNVEASTTSGLELSYAISGPGSIQGTTVTLDGTLGTVEITVSQAGNEDYNPASAAVSFEVVEDPCLGFSVSASSSAVNCAGSEDGSIEIQTTEGMAPFTYTISGGEATDSNLFSGLAAGEYTIDVTDANGCTAVATAVIESPEPLEVTADVVESTSINGNGSISLTVSGGSGNYSYSWSNGATTADLSDLEMGEYTVTITDDAGCSLTENYSIGGVTANSEAFELNLYPNPVINQVEIVHGEKVNEISLIDANGRIILKQKTTGAASRIEMKALPAGVYFIRLDNGKMQRIIKQ